MKDEELGKTRMELLKTFCKPSHFNPDKKEKHLLNTLGLELLKQVYQKQ